MSTEDVRRAVDLEDVCHRYRLQLVEALPARRGGSIFVAHVRNEANGHFVLKRIDPVSGEREIPILKALNGSGVTSRFETELEPGLYLAEWLTGPSLAMVPPDDAVDGEGIGRAIDQLHRTSPPESLPDVHDEFHPGRATEWRFLDRRQQVFGQWINSVLWAYRPPNPVLLHGDLVPGNVILTRDGLRFIDPVGRRGLPVWDLAQLDVAAEGRGRTGLLPALLTGYGRGVPMIAEMVAWMALHYLDKNLAGPGSPFTPRLQRLVERLLAADDTGSFLDM